MSFAAEGGLFKQGAFQIDPNSTPEMLAAKRKQIASMMPKYGQAKYIGEGLGQLAHGIMAGSKNRQMNKFEGEKRSEATSMLGGLSQNNGVSPEEFMSILGINPQAEQSAMGGTYTPPNPNDEAYPVDQTGSPPMGNVDVASGLNMGENVNDGVSAATSMIAGFEGFRETPYWDVNADRAGYGSDTITNSDGSIRKVTKGDRVTRAQADMDLNRRITQEFMPSARRSVGAEIFDRLNRSQQAALTSITYNYGTLPTSVARAVQSGSVEGTTEAISALGSHNDGINASRRNQEALAYAGNGTPSPTPATVSTQGNRVAQDGGFDLEHLNNLMVAAQNPWLSSQQRTILNTQIKIQQGQQQAAQERYWAQQDPMYQAQLAKAQAEVERMKSGAPSANSAFGNLDAQAQAAGLQPDTPEYQTFMLNGGGAPATFRALDMQAQASGFQPGTQEYNNFMATRGAGLQAGAKTAAENAADIATGGAAESAKAAGGAIGKATVDAGMGAWESYGKLQTSLGNIDEAISAIDGGAQSGLVYNMLPSITQASASLDNAMNRMGLDVVGAVTFCALSEGELKLAMSTAVPQNLAPKELRAWLVRRRDAQAKAANMAADAAQFLTKPGNTINGWVEKNRATSAGKPAPVTAPPEGEQGAQIPPLPPAIAAKGVTPERWPAVWDALSPSAKAYYSGASQ